MESDLVFNESGQCFFNITDSYFLSDDDSTLDDLKIDLQNESLEDLIDYFNFIQLKDETVFDEERPESEHSERSEHISIYVDIASINRKQRRRADRIVLTPSQKANLLLSFEQSDTNKESCKEFLTSDTSNVSFVSAKSEFKETSNESFSRASNSTDSKQLEEGEIRTETDSEHSHILPNPHRETPKRAKPIEFQISSSSNQTSIKTPGIKTPVLTTPQIRRINPVEFLARTPTITTPQMRRLDAEYIESLNNMDVTYSNRNYITLRCFNIFNQHIFSNRLPDLQIYWNNKINSTIGLYSEADRSISLNPKLLLKAELLRDCLLHEMIHSAVTLIDKRPLMRSSNNLFNTWVTLTNQVFPELKLLSRCTGADLSYAWHYMCNSCSITYKRQRNTIDINKKHCICGGSLSVYRNGGILTCRYFQERNMNSVHDNLFDSDKKNELLKTALQISSGSKKLSDYCTEIRDLALNRDTEIRRNALNEFAFIVINLPVDFLSTDELKFLLNFFSLRFTDSGHSADLLVTVVHHLVFAQKTFEEEEADALFHTIFDDNGVQAYIQSDREKLLDIFELFVKEHFQIVEKMGIQFYTIFANSVGGERDPRCLLKTFSIFVYAMERIDLGPMMEDVFELAACYWPISYEPKLTDKNPLSSEVLSAACDACLLANRGFSLYTYQLISEKLVEDDESTTHEQKLEACKLLSRACQKFGPTELDTFLGDILAGFRMLCLNPKNHGANSETLVVIGDTLKVLLDTVKSDVQNSEQTLKEMAKTMLENCEPFVIQPEMGLSAKALGLLEKMSVANELICDIILPRVFYWTYVLISGTTIKNQANKEEIFEETLLLLPHWFLLARNTDQLDTNQVHILLSAIQTMDDFPKTQRLKTLCECLSVLLKHDADLSNESKNIVDKTVQFIVESFEDYEEALRLPIFTFVSSVASKSTEKCTELSASLATSAKWSNIQFLICGALMNGSKQLSKLLPIYLGNLSKTEYLLDGTSILLLLFGKIAGSYSGNLYDDFVVPLLDFLSSFASVEVEKERLKQMSTFLQDLGLLLNKESHSKLLDACVHHLSKPTINNIILLTPSAETHKRVVEDLNRLWETNKHSELPAYASAFYFAYQNRSKNECEDVEVALVDQEVKLATKCRSKLLTQTQLPNKRVFESNSSLAMEQLLDFETELTDPAKCCYKKTLMWAQRIVIQFIPFFAEQYKLTNTSEDSAGDHVKQYKQSMISLIIPLLRLAKRVTIPMVSELEMLFPIIVDALYEPNVSQDQLLLLAGSTTQLLELSSNKALSQDNVIRITYILEKVLLSAESSNKVVFAALDVLEVLAKQAQSIAQFCRSDQTLMAVRHAVQSKKRVIRQKAAHVRGLWEMLPKI
ncbi:MMS19 nucleotide excision repair protein [Aphelenchoides bicaudatus]|nr:MMS19 nucleotide excision repair protein [Aphelenchoides bicaudatus]